MAVEHVGVTNSCTSLAFQSGAVIGERYLVLEHAGEGSTASVFKCRDLSNPGRIIALHVLLPQLAGDPAAAARFEQEFALSKRLGHANIIRAFDYFPLNNTVAFTSEYAAGGSLQDRFLSGGALPFDAIRRLAVQLCAALHYLHGAGVIHHNITPRSILLTEEGDVKIGGFRFARLISRTGQAALDVSGDADYTSPEFVLSGVIHPRSDLYALGIVLYQATTGRYPFRRHPEQLLSLKERMTAQPTPPAHLRVACPPELNQAILKAMSRVPAGRYATPEELVDDLYTPAVSGTIRPAAPSRAAGQSRPAVVSFPPMQAAMPPAMQTPAYAKYQQEPLLLPMMPASTSNPYVSTKSVILAPFAMLSAMFLVLTLGFYQPGDTGPGAEEAPGQIEAVIGRPAAPVNPAASDGSPYASAAPQGDPSAVRLAEGLSASSALNSDKTAGDNGRGAAQAEAAALPITGSVEALRTESREQPLGNTTRFSQLDFTAAAGAKGAQGNERRESAVSAAKPALSQLYFAGKE